MFTLIFDENKKQPLYEQIYMQIRRMIEAGELKDGDKLPSKRKLSSHLNVSQSTVENAYTQLIDEGYIYSIEKKGYFISQVEQIQQKPQESLQQNIRFSQETNILRFDLKTNAVDTSSFQFSVWSRLMRECLNRERTSLLNPVHPQGDFALREEIAAYLREYRSMNIFSEQIVLGAGTEYLLGLITELLTESHFAIENPGYYKTAKILHSKRRKTDYISMDKEGLRIDELKRSRAEVVHITPSHHYPLGTIMSIGRRMQILQWAAQEENRYIIEDDYDSEYRFVLKPIPSLQSLDSNGKVIYINSFAKTLAPSLRISYMALPQKLLEIYRERLMFYSCTVSEFEQHTLKAFMQGGYYARHLNRMRNIYKNRRDCFLEALAPLSGMITINGQDAGTHLLLGIENDMSEMELVESAMKKGVGVYALSDCYFKDAIDTGTIITGYAGLKAEELREAAELLIEAWK